MNVHPEDVETTAEHGTFGRLLSDMMRDLATLLRQEVDLARVELLEQAGRAKGGAIKFGAAGVLGMAGVLLLSGAAALGLTLLLSMTMPLLGAACLGTLFVGAILVAAAGVFFQMGKRETKPAEFVPRRTLDSLKENAEWAKRQLH